MSDKFHRRRFLQYGKLALLSSIAYGVTTSKERLPLAQTAPPDNTIANLEKQIPSLLSKYIVPGVSLAIVRDGQIFWSKSFGVKNRRTQQSVDNNSIFAAASLGKPLFAYSVLKLVDRGSIDLDTPLTNYTRKPYITDSRLHLITARMVLCHTAGFPNWSGNGPLRVITAPGTRFQYSGEGYLYMQHVVEEIAGEPLESYLQRELLVPWGMSASSYVWQDRYATIATDGHDRSGSPVAMARPKKAIAAGSLRTTATDYARFLMAMMAEGTAESSYLTATSLSQMLRPQFKVTPSIPWGLGWSLESASEGDYFWHWGDNGIFTAFAFGSRSLRKGVAILTNSKNGLKLCRAIVPTAIGGQHPALAFGEIDY